MDKPTRCKIMIFIVLVFISFSFGVFLGVGYCAAKDMDYDIGQALELLATPIDTYQSEPESIMPEPATTYLGTFITTAYCPCEICCGKWSNPSDPKTASGTTPTELITVGADWDKLPKGTSLYIDGVGERIVEDKVASWVAKKYDGEILDLFMYDHQDCLDFGKQELDVWEIK